MKSVMQVNYEDKIQQLVDLVNTHREEINRTTALQKPTIGVCSSCGTKTPVTELETDYGHHDGWEMPAYTIFYCNVCEDGGSVDDFTHDMLPKIKLEDYIPCEP